MSATKAFAAELAINIAKELAGCRVQKRVYSVTEAAEYLGCSEKKIQGLAASKDLPCVRYDRYLRFDVRDLDKFIEDEKV